MNITSSSMLSSQRGCQSSLSRVHLFNLRDVQFGKLYTTKKVCKDAANKCKQITIYIIYNKNNKSHTFSRRCSSRFPSKCALSIPFVRYLINVDVQLLVTPKLLSVSNRKNLGVIYNTKKSFS